MKYKVLRIDKRCFFLIVEQPDRVCVVRIGNSRHLEPTLDAMTTHVLIGRLLPPNLLQELVFYRHTLDKGIKYISLPNIFEQFIGAMRQQEGAMIQLERSIIRDDIADQQRSSLERVFIYFYKSKNVQFRTNNEIIFDLKAQLSENFSEEEAQQNRDFLKLAYGTKNGEFLNQMFDSEKINSLLDKNSEYFARMGVDPKNCVIALHSKDGTQRIELVSRRGIIFNNHAANTFFIRTKHSFCLLSEYKLLCTEGEKTHIDLLVRVYGFIKPHKERREVDYRFHPSFANQETNEQLRFLSRLKNQGLLSKASNQRHLPRGQHLPKSSA